MVADIKKHYLFFQYGKGQRYAAVAGEAHGMTAIEPTLEGMQQSALLYAFKLPVMGAGRPCPGPLFPKFHGRAHAAGNEIAAFIINRVIKQIGGKQHGYEIFPAIAAGLNNLRPANGNGLQFIYMAFAAHFSEILRVLTGQLLAEKMPVGIQIPAHPAGLNLEKHVRGNLREMSRIKVPVGLPDQADPGSSRIRADCLRWRLAAVNTVAKDTQGRNFLPCRGAGRPEASALSGFGNLFIEKIPNAAKNQQRKNPHTCATGSKQRAKENPADSAAKKTAHKASAETAAGSARRCGRSRLAIVLG
jgi:hypothetical protein